MFTALCKVVVNPHCFYSRKNKVLKTQKELKPKNINLTETCNRQKYRSLDNRP
jgi:hypothetical protein